MKSFPLLLAFAGAALAVEPPRALPPSEAPKDPRLGELKDLNGYFPFTPSPTPEAWTQRAGQVRMQMRVALGLWPEPTRTPLNAVIHGRIEQPDYTVEKVAFESMPGFFVTGSLFRPRTPGPHPAVLCPHGHWPDGRFQRRDDKEMKKELESGGERFAESGRSIFQSLGVQLARMGCVAFVIDMLGYADSQQISYEVAHKFAKQRPEMNAREDWGLFSPQAEAHAQSVLGLQTWNCMRALDFLIALPDVDAKRLGCTGASGGGTQTMLLGALDPRLTVAAPAVMVSTAMQGGCTCENASLLRIGTGNVEFAALFAPKPMGMSSAKDWTVEMPTKGFPELQKHWAMLGAPDAVKLWHHPEFGHNYNLVTREHIYAFFNEHLKLGLPEDRLKEREYDPLTREQLTVWDAAHPAPSGGPDFERKLLRWWHDDAQVQMAKLSVFDRLQAARRGWKVLLAGDHGEMRGTTLASRMELAPGSQDEADPVRFRTQAGVLTGRHGNKRMSVLWLRPKERIACSVIWLDERGQTGLFSRDGKPRPEVARFLEAGCEIVGIDLVQQGDRRGDGTKEDRNRQVANPREAAAYTFGYNAPLLAQRVDDLNDLLGVQITLRSQPPPVFLLALDRTAIVAAATLALQPALWKGAVLDTRGIRFGALTDWCDANFLPGAAKYGDLPGLISLAAPTPIYVLGEKETPRGAPVTLEPAGAAHDAALDWLLRVAGEGK